MFFIRGESMGGDIPNEIVEELYPEEKIIDCIKKKKGTGLEPKYLGITNRRVIYFVRKVLGRYYIEDIPYEKIEGVYLKRGKLGAEFTLHNENGTKIRIDWIDGAEAKKAMEEIREALNNISIEPISIKKKKGLFKEEWSFSKPKEVVVRS
jgi:hypothetical protein